MATFTERIALEINAKTAGAVAPLGQLEKQAKQTETAWDKAAKSVGVSSQTLKTGLVAGATALVGTGLVQFLDQTAGAYADAALAANQLSRATNASTEDASRFVAVASQYGLGLNDLTEIFADLQQSVGEGKVNLEELGVTLAKNKDGTTDWIATGVELIDTINRLPDATERMDKMFAAFGEEGAKQLMTLAASGKTVEEQMAAISTAQIFGTKDVQAAQEYNEAMRDLASSSKAVQLGLGQTLAPLVTGITNALVPMIEILGEIPTEMYLVAGAAVVLNKALTSTLVQGAFIAVVRGLASIRTAMVAYQSALGVMAAATLITMESLTAALLANPVGLIVGTLAVAVGLFMHVAGDLDDRSQQVAASFDDLTESGLSAADAITKLAGEMESQQNVLEGFVAGFRENTGRNILMSLFAPTAVINGIRLLSDALKGGGADANFYNDQLAKIVEEQGSMAGLTADAAAKQKDFNDMLAEGGHSAEELGVALSDAANAAHKKEVIDRTAKDALEDYADATWDAVDATLAMFNAEFAAKDAHRGVADAIDGVAEAQEAYNEARKKAVGDDYTQAQKDRDVAAAKREISAAHDDVAQAMLRDAAAQAQLRTGATDTVAAYDVMLATLNKDLKLKGLSKEDKKKITDMIADIEAAKQTAAGGIEIGGIRFKGGTTEAEVTKLQDDIKLAFANGMPGAAAALQAELDALKIPAMPVALTGPDGKPLGAIELKPHVGPVEGLDSATAAINALSGDREAKVNAVVYNQENSLNVLNGLVGNREAQIHAVVYNQENSENVLDGLAERRTAEIHATVMNEKNSRNVLNGLSEDRTVHINIVYRRFGTPPGSGEGEGEAVVLRRNIPAAAMTSLVMGPQFSTAGPSLMATSAADAAGGSASIRATAGGVTYSPTIVNNYPAPERASDNLAMSLRIARYTMGGVL